MNAKAVLPACALLALLVHAPGALASNNLVAVNVSQAETPTPLAVTLRVQLHYADPDLGSEGWSDPFTWQTGDGANGWINTGWVADSGTSTLDDGRTYSWQRVREGSVSYIDITYRYWDPGSYVVTWNLCCTATGSPSGSLVVNAVGSVLWDEVVPVVVPGVDENLLIIDGAPREGDTRFYEIRVTVAGEALPVITINTGGNLQAPIHQELLHVPGQEGQVRVGAYYGHDETQETSIACLGDTCATSPFDPFDPLWSAENGFRTGVIIGGCFQGPSGVGVCHFVNVPVAGQVLGYALG